MMQRVYLMGIMGALVFCHGCDRYRVYEENIAIPQGRWIKDNTPFFTFAIEDTAVSYNVYINTRNNAEYYYRNLYLFIEWISPQNKKARDTFNIMLADEKGKWLGRGSGNLYFKQTPYKIQVKFPEKGNYKITITQAMRHDTLDNITDIGVRVERAMP